MSIEIKQDLEKRTLELTQAKYWEKAVERFAEFLPKDNVEVRRVPYQQQMRDCLSNRQKMR